MENATKAMLIAAGVLIGIMILTLGVTLYSEFSSYMTSARETMEFNEQNSFNAQFTKYVNYIGIQKQFDLTIQDVVTAANTANEINKVNDAQPGDHLYVAVFLGTQHLEYDGTDIAKLLKDGLPYKYKCSSTDVKFSTVTGRICEIHFSQE